MLSDPLEACHADTRPTPAGPVPASRSKLTTSAASAASMKAVHETVPTSVRRCGDATAGTICVIGPISALGVSAFTPPASHLRSRAGMPRPSARSLIIDGQARQTDDLSVPQSRSNHLAAPFPAFISPEFESDDLPADRGARNPRSSWSPTLRRRRRRVRGTQLRAQDAGGRWRRTGEDAHYRAPLRRNSCSRWSCSLRTAPTCRKASSCSMHSVARFLAFDRFGQIKVTP